MAQYDQKLEPIEPAAERPAGAQTTPTPWGNSAPLALIAFAVTTFMVSLINANVVNVGTLGFVFGVALMFGGLTQLIAGIIELRNGKTFGGLFSGFGAFWLSIFAVSEFELKTTLLPQVGHGFGLLYYTFGIFAAVMLLTALRSTIATCLALTLLVAALFLLGAGNYTASTGLVKTGGWVGIILAGLAFYLALAELCEVSYGREILPVGHLAKS
jgi:uncharacterized protein